MADEATQVANINLASILADHVPRAEHESLLDSLQEVIDERDELKRNKETSTTRITDLEKRVRSRAYRDTFGKVAKELNVNEADRDDVFELLKITQDADEPNEGAIKQTLETFLNARPGRYKVSGDGKPPKLNASEDSSRGPSGRPGDPELRVSQAQLKNALFMRDNQAAIAKAQRAGTLIVEDR